jgi:hypothetical protein
MARRNGFPILVLFVVAALGVTYVVGCGGGSSSGSGSGGGTLTVSGTLGPDYLASATPGGFFARVLRYLNPQAYAVGASGVDQVIAIPMSRGELSGWSMQSSLTATVNPTGTFSLPLTTDSDWLLLLINTTIMGPGRYVGSVALNTGADSMLNVPATDAGISTLDLGTLSQSGQDAVSGNTVSGAAFNLTADQLASMAKTSDIFHNAMNIVNNYDPDTGIWYQMRPNFLWNGDYSALAASYSDPNSYSFSGNGGINFQMDTNSTSVTMDNICNKSVIVEFVPPVGSPISSADITGCRTVQTDGCEAGDCRETFGSTFFASNAYGDVPGESISYGMQTYFASVSPGLWRWTVDGSAVGQFDIAAVSPPVTAGGKPKGYVPSYKLTVDPATHRITAIDIKWYYYEEGTSSYVELLPSDLGVLKHFIGQAEVSFDVTDGGNRKKWDCYFDPVTTTHIDPSVGVAGAGGGCLASPDTWYYNDASHPATNTGLNGFFETGGFGYYFQFFVPMGG